MNNHSEELKHYGVLGMKWGMRRAAKKGVEYSYKSHGQRKYEKKVANLQAKPASKGNKMQRAKNTIKLEKAKTKLAMYKARDLNRVEYAAKTNIGKAAVKSAVFGGIGTGAYNRFRSAGYNRCVSVLGSFAPITSKIVENNAAKNRAKNNK